MSNMQNDTRNATVRYEDPLQTTLLGRLLQLCWLVPSLVLILGLNCLFLVAILRTKKLWRPRFVLPASLCVLDIIQGSLFIPSSVVNIAMGGNSNPVWFCWTQASFSYVGAVCTLSTLTLMAWDRYQAICNAIHNPVIYGLNSKDVQNAVAKICGSNHCTRKRENVYDVSRPRASSKDGVGITNHVRMEQVCHQQITTLSITKRNDQM
ncbi:Src y 2 domains-containing protein [Branchiostoma belcheri]|nr:Src y 2 domains-containing protein [Branchiostoma belcheri]